MTSFNNLSAELQQAVKEAYPLGFTDSMIRIEKPDGSFFCAVSFATPEIDYLVKIDVKVDNKRADDKDIFDEDIKGGDDELQTDDEDEDESRPRRVALRNEFDDNDDDM